MGLLEKVPFWFWTLAVVVGGALLLRGASVTDTTVGGFAYDLTVQNIIPLIAILLPFLAALFAIIGIVHLVHDHEKSIALFTSAGLLGAIALVWHWFGQWILVHWLVRPV